MSLVVLHSDISIRASSISFSLSLLFVGFMAFLLDFVSGVIFAIYTIRYSDSALGDEPPQHTVMALVSTFLAGRIWVCEIDLQCAVFQKRKPRKL